MQTPTPGEPSFVLKRSHMISEDLRAQERTADGPYGRQCRQRAEF